MGGPLRAGVAAVPFALPPGVAMMGYGARQGVATGAADPLGARALHLEGPGGAALLVLCDLCLMAPTQAGRVRGELATRTGLDPSRILVGCTHTHSGPETGLGALLAGAPEPDHVAGLLEAAVRAGLEAFAARAPARLGVGHARARVGRNRRRADGPLDEDVLVLRVDAPDGAPRAVLFVHGCHPTALGHDNLRTSADWPGAARARVEARLPGATALFALGAHADVDPRTRGLLDLAISGQSVGVGLAEARALGEEVGEAVATAAEAVETRADAVVVAAATRVPLAARRPDEASRRDAFAALGLAPDADVGTGELFRLEQERTASLPEAARREARARVRRYLRDRTARRFAFGERPEVEVQVLRLGAARLLALPLEPTVAVGLDWKARAGTSDAAVLGIANGWMRYLPHARDLEAPGAEVAYEVLQSTFGPDAAARLLEAGEELLRRLETEARA
jgi:hypothetical protein